MRLICNINEHNKTNLVFSRICLVPHVLFDDGEVNCRVYDPRLSRIYMQAIIWKWTGPLKILQYWYPVHVAARLILQNRKIGKKSWWIVVICQICLSFFPSKVFYCMVSQLPSGSLLNKPTSSYISLSLLRHSSVYPNVHISPCVMLLVLAVSSLLTQINYINLIMLLLLCSFLLFFWQSYRVSCLRPVAVGTNVQHFNLLHVMTIIITFLTENLIKVC